MNKRQRWFDEGAAALRRTLERTGCADAGLLAGYWHACPCCLGLYAPQAVNGRNLTIEDVPPRALGGRPMLLTCKPCNNNAGSELHAHAATQAVGDSFARGIVNRSGVTWHLPDASSQQPIAQHSTTQQTAPGWSNPKD